MVFLIGDAGVYHGTQDLEKFVGDVVKNDGTELFLCLALKKRGLVSWLVLDKGHGGIMEPSSHMFGSGTSRPGFAAHRASTGMLMGAYPEIGCQAFVVEMVGEAVGNEQHSGRE